MVDIEIEEKGLIVIGKIIDNCYNFSYNNELNEPVSIISPILKSDVSDVDTQYIKLVIEILTFFKNENIYDKIIIHIPHLFVAECLENWIEKWKKNDFYIEEKSNESVQKVERPNRDLLLQVSKLKDTKFKIVYNYRILS